MTGRKKLSAQAHPAAEAGGSTLALQTLRMQAEATLRRNSADLTQKIAAMPPEEIQQMLHELLVHRIELEMQNEELRRTQAELDAARARYFDLYTLAPVGYVTLSAGGLILEANLTAANLLGAPQGELVRQPITRFIHGEDQDVYHLHCQQYSDTSTPRPCDLRMRKQDGTIFWAHLVITATQQADGEPTNLLALSDITERTQLEEALRESEVRFRRLLRDVPSVAVQGYGPNGTTQYWNLASEQLYGYTAQEAIGRNLLDLIIPPDMRQEVKEAMRQMAATGKPIPAAELLLKRKDGSRVNVYSSHAVVQVPGRAPELFCLDIDLTERRRAEEALRESEERYRRLFDLATEALFLVDIDTGRIVNANKTASEIYGYGKEEFLAKRCADLMAEPNEPCAIITTILAAPDEIVYIPLRQHRKKNGAVFPVEITARSMPLGGRQIILVGIRDITRRMQNREALRQSEQQRILVQETANAQLREQADNLQSIYQALDSIGLIVCKLEGDDGRIITFNPGAEKMLGYRQDEVIGKSISLIYPPEVADLIPVRINRFRQGKARLSYNMILTRKSGEIFHAIVSIHPFDYHQGRFRKVVGVFRDISELMGVQEQLKAANNALEERVEQRTLELQETQKRFLHAEKLSAIGKLSASIAHEFNNPLQGIMSILKGLKKRAVLEEEDKELLDAAISESERIKDLIRSLQEFNRPSSGKKVAMDVHKSIDSMLLLNKSDFNGKRISVNRKYAEQLPHIYAVPDQIKQVLLNLLTNAADACAPHGGTISISTWQEDLRVAIAIQDTGIGIQPEEMEQIFQPFYTTKPAVKGTGLGLSVSHGIIQHHHGEIRVESRPGEGATFTILLPIRDEDASAPAPQGDLH
jgi:PAS domain S-box-containing protein